MVISWEAARSAGWQTFSEFIAAKLIPRRDTEGTNSCSFSLKPNPLRLSGGAARFRAIETGRRRAVHLGEHRDSGIPARWEDHRGVVCGRGDRALYRDKGSSKRLETTRRISHLKD